MTVSLDIGLRIVLQVHNTVSRMSLILVFAASTSQFLRRNATIAGRKTMSHNIIEEYYKSNP